jgi:hypothetical protein
MRSLEEINAYQKNMRPKGMIFCHVKVEIPKNFFSSGEAAMTGAGKAVAWMQTLALRLASEPPHTSSLGYVQ